MLHFLAILIPILLVYIYFAFPNQAVSISLTPLGRFITIIIVLFYTDINIWYGLLACVLVILYYQMDFVEGMSNMLSPHLLQQPTFTLPNNISYFASSPAGLSTPIRSPKKNEEWDIFDWISPSPEEAEQYGIDM